MMRSVELFYDGDGDAPSGALVINRQPQGGSVSMRFSLDDEATFARHLEISFTDSVFGWDQAVFTADNTTVLKRDQDIITVGEQPVQASSPIVPSYAVSFLVAEFARDGSTHLPFSWLDEESATIQEAELTRGSGESIDSPVQTLNSPCETIILEVAGQTKNTYWLHGGTIVRSDWNGANSYALPASVVHALYAPLDRPTAENN